MLYPDNQASWDAIVKFYEHFKNTDHWCYVAPICRLVHTVAASERATRFRAGQSLTTLVISTTPYHGLKPDDLSVSVKPEFDGEEVVSFSVEYTRGRNVLLERWTCAEDELLFTLDIALTRLWTDTKVETTEPGG